MKPLAKKLGKKLLSFSNPNILDYLQRRYISTNMFCFTSRSLLGRVVIELNSFLTCAVHRGVGQLHVLAVVTVAKGTPNTLCK